ncbi:MAG: hypothetical protein GIKADHBN_03260 [Phycisphaerales bacterium]|nr:hypothetical protein [Phycisphaerales bacterium]
MGRADVVHHPTSRARRLRRPVRTSRASRPVARTSRPLRAADRRGAAGHRPAQEGRQLRRVPAAQAPTRWHPPRTRPARDRLRPGVRRGRPRTGEHQVAGRGAGRARRSRSRAAVPPARWLRVADRLAGTLARPKAGARAGPVAGSRDPVAAIDGPSSCRSTWDATTGDQRATGDHHAAAEHPGAARRLTRRRCVHAGHPEHPGRGVEDRIGPGGQGGAAVPRGVLGALARAEAGGRG